MIIAGTLGLLICALFIVDNGPGYDTTTFVDAIPPEEFLTTSVDASMGATIRRPSNVSLTAAEILSSRKKFDDLNRAERRSLYNAVIYFCNEERDAQACGSYVKYCGKNCQLLVQGPPDR